MRLSDFSFSVFKPGSQLYGVSLNIVMLVYAALLPFSNAFTVHTGPSILMILWLLEGRFEEKRRIFSDYASPWALSLFFLFAALSLLWTEDMARGLRELKYYFVIFSVFIVYFTSLRKRYRKAVLYAFLLAMFISEIYSYGIFFDWWSVEGASASNPTPPYMHHIRYSIYLVVTVILLLFQLSDRAVPAGLKMAELFFLLSSSVNLFINGGRTGQLALVVALILFVVARFGLRWRYLLSTFLLLFAIFYSAYHLSPVFRSRALMAVEDIRRIVVHGDFENSWGERIAMAIVASHEIADNPLVGVGVGDTMSEYRKELCKKELRKYSYTHDVPHVHNQFLQICAQTGAIGLALFVLFLFSLLKEAKRAPSSLYRAALYSNLSIFLFGFFSSVIIRNYTSGLFAFVLAYLLAGCKEESSQP